MVSATVDLPVISRV